MPITIGFLVNPRAGEGLNVRMNGSDFLRDFKFHGYAASRASKFLESLSRDYPFKTAAGDMGEKVLRENDFEHVEVIYTPEGETCGEDTTKFIEIAEKQCDIILFAGGDGTARDIFLAAPEVPILGIPAGMKMYSSIFAETPERASLLIDMYSDGKGQIQEAVIQDAMEEKMSEGELKIIKYGVLKSIGAEHIFHDPKIISFEWSEDGISNYVVDTMDSSYYLIGTGSTCKEIINAMGYETTIFSVDLVRDHKIIKRDYYPEDFHKYIHGDDTLKIVVSPYAGNGFFLGRGNRQIDSRAILKAGKDGVMIVSSPRKLETIRGLVYDVENIPAGYFGKFKRVVTGYDHFTLVPLLS